MYSYEESAIRHGHVTDIINVEFHVFEAFVKKLMKDFEEDLYLNWLLSYDTNYDHRFPYTDEKSGTSFILFHYKEYYDEAQVGHLLVEILRIHWQNFKGF